MIPRVLIISNTEFNLSDSNGRALGLLLQGIPNENKMQFCIHGSSVSSELIRNCYRISDFDVLKGLFKWSVKATRLMQDVSIKQSNGNKKRLKRTPIRMLARDVLWSLKIPRLEFIKLALDFKPDIIIWQYGDSGFLAGLTRKLAVLCHAKIIIFSTEDYYFKTWNYLNKGGKSFIYRLFHKEMRFQTKKTIDIASLCICNTPHLAARFQAEFHCKTDVIMQSASDIGPKSRPNVKKRIVYTGNLGLNRHVSLIQIAETLYSIDNTIVFEIYGKTSAEIEKALRNVPNIRFMGFVSYQEVIQVIQDSLLIVHAESFDEFYTYDLQAAFSTKIPDSLSAGIPFFLYAPANLAETKYLQENNCAFVCTDRQNLLNKLQIALTDSIERDKIVNVALEISKTNHNSLINQKKMVQLLEKVSME